MSWLSSHAPAPADLLVHALVMTGVACSILAGFSSPAMAQDNYVEEEEALVHVPSRRVIIAPAFAVNLGFSTQLRVDGKPRKNTHLSLAGGITGNVEVSPNVLGFVSGNLEMEQHELVDGRSVTYFMPMLHAGASFIGCYDDDDAIGVVEAMFPCARVYGLAGFRPAPPGRPGSLRLGLGVSSVWIPFAALSAGTVLPSSYETIMEVDPLGNRLFMFRIGLGF